MTISQTILPSRHHFARKKAVPHQLNLEAICVYIATGFFMDDDTYWKDMVCLQPAHEHQVDAEGYLLSSKPNFDWFYNPRRISFQQALEEYSFLLHEIIKEQVSSSEVILPLSGGLDSRSQALVLKKLKNPVQAFSYSFRNGYPEHLIAQQIAGVCGFDFKAFKIDKGYLWGCIKELSQLNGCYSEFTHPRQMAILPHLKKMNGVFSLGHWGDVLFERGIPRGVSNSEIVSYLMKAMVKPRGLKLAQKLWEYWNVEGEFMDYLVARIESSLSLVKIENSSAKLRAYKTMQWAHRWTTTNLCVFDAASKITLPYYDDRMFKFVCSTPEEFLAYRKLQIEHLKQDKEIAGITWQDHRPFNLLNYQYNKFPFNLPYRVLNKLQRVGQNLLGNQYIQRNWELQFLGTQNSNKLRSYLFNEKFNSWIPKKIVHETYQDFRTGNSVLESHAVSMLLTLSLWYENK